MKHERDCRTEGMNPKRDIFQKTAAFIAALRKTGCRAPKCEETVMNPTEKSTREHEASLSRGYMPLDEFCEGSIRLEFDQLDHPLVR